MFKRIFISILTIFSFLCIHAQEIGDYFYVDPNDKETLDLGLRMGYAANGLYGDLFKNPLPITAFTGGVYYRHPLNKSKNISFYSEVSFSFKGAKFNESGDSSIDKIALVYFDFPLCIDYLFKEVKKSENQSVKYRFTLGLQPSILMRSSLFRNMDKEGVAYIYKLPLYTMDYAVVAGVPIEFPLGYGKMGFSVFLKYGLRNINRDMESFGNLNNFASGHRANNWQIAFNVTF